MYWENYKNIKEDKVPGKIMSRSILSKENYLSGGKIRRKTCREEEIWGKDVAHPLSDKYFVQCGPSMMS